MFALIKAYYKFVKTTWPGTQLLSLTVKNSTDRASGESWDRKTLQITSLVLGVYGCARYQKLYQGLQVQMWLAERAYGKVGEEHNHDKWNRGEIFPGESRRGGTRDPISVDISTTRHNGYGVCVCGSGEDDLVNLFASYFLRKEKIPLTHRKSSKYDISQEIHIGNP